MKHKIIIWGIATIIQIDCAHAVIRDKCPSTTCPANMSTDPTAAVQVITQCFNASRTTCFKGPSGTIYAVNICDSCPSGSSLTNVSISDLIGGECSGDSFALSIQTCCSTCTNCADDTTYIAHGTGYESKSTRSCSCGGCNATSTSYRCAAGYYGSSTNGTTGCAACSNGGTSVAGSNTSITSCYLPTGSYFSDTSGNGNYTGNCYYSTL